MTDDERAALVEQRLREVLQRLITEQSEGEWDDKTIQSDVEAFMPAILAAIEPAVRADEREACARIADEYAEENKNYAAVHYSALPAIARAIRARGDRSIAPPTVTDEMVELAERAYWGDEVARSAYWYDRLAQYKRMRAALNAALHRGEDR